ncbi:hypothetical protein TCAL_15497 [Tigriopus californicus]|uniref:Uncharacterized protein n=1 Tax=Tigriopus californicus TaxID=6832 RepID=A0A553PRW6_TIGCA|nr:hypothetical protein TCAL_15497 [Tigriopus californicus]
MSHHCYGDFRSTERAASQSPCQPDINLFLVIRGHGVQFLLIAHNHPFHLINLVIFESSLLMHGTSGEAQVSVQRRQPWNG